MNWRAQSLALIAVLALVGCGSSEDEPEATGSSSAQRATTSGELPEDLCELLARDGLADIIERGGVKGATIRPGVPRTPREPETTIGCDASVEGDTGYQGVDLGIFSIPSKGKPSDEGQTPGGVQRFTVGEYQCIGIAEPDLGMAQSWCDDNKNRVIFSYLLLDEPNEVTAPRYRKDIQEMTEIILG